MAQSAAIFIPHTRTNTRTHTLGATGAVEVITCPPALCTHGNTGGRSHLYVLSLTPYYSTQMSWNPHRLHEHYLPPNVHTNKAHRLSSTSDFVPVTLGECCQWLLLRFLRGGLEGGWKKKKHLARDHITFIPLSIHSSGWWMRVKFLLVLTDGRGVHRNSQQVHLECGFYLNSNKRHH